MMDDGDYDDEDGEDEMRMVRRMIMTMLTLTMAVVGVEFRRTRVSVKRFES